jgi:hypothetical protein
VGRQTHVALIEVIEEDERAEAGGRTILLEKQRFLNGTKTLEKGTRNKGPSLCQDLTAAKMPDCRDRAGVSTFLQRLYNLYFMKQRYVSDSANCYPELLCDCHVAKDLSSETHLFDLQLDCRDHAEHACMKEHRETCYGVLPAYGLFWKVLCRTLSVLSVQCRLPHDIFSRLPAAAELANRCCSILCSCQRGSGQFCGSRPGPCNYDFLPPHVQPFGLRSLSLKPSLKKCFSIWSSDVILSDEKKGLCSYKSRSQCSTGRRPVPPRGTRNFSGSCSNIRGRFR